MIDGRRGQSTASGTEDAPVDGPATQLPDLAELAEVPATEETAEPPGRGVRKGFGVGARLVRMGVTANQVTVVGILLAGVTGVTIGLGRFWIGVVLLTVGGLMDTLDGVVAKAAGTASKRGAFFDSVADRVADALIFGGVAWYLASGRDPRLAVLPFAILGVSAVISYERAKAESLGYDAKGGLMERAERLILLGVALVLHVILAPLLGLLLALSVFTAVQRFAKVWRQASRETTTSETARGPWRRGRVESRWQSWRQPRTSGTSGTRRRATTPSRLRARRRSEPLGVRLRRVLATERSGTRRAVPRAERRSFRARSPRHRQPGTGS
ncbi:MAG TPA: CDP-alcohol phosphatidyltransferase family protein [Acidimicrobiales bacterium]|nr:CDP-alcohol phosphatidyltransferase family protein [Acidimicrobiales bacterium]